MEVETFKAPKSKGRAKTHLRRKRQESSSSESEEEEEESEEDNSSGDDSDPDAERKKDMQERDEFANRLKSRDKEKTRSVMTKSDKKAYEEASKRLRLEQEDRKKIIPELRKQSRRDYLKKRGKDKLEDLEADIEDEIRFFGHEKLTSREKKDLEYKKTVLKLAKEHRSAGELEKVDRYYIPRDDVKPQDKYVEDKTGEYV